MTAGTLDSPRSRFEDLLDKQCSVTLYVICSVICCCINLDVIKLSLDVGNLVIKASTTRWRGNRVSCHALVTLGIFVSLNFVIIVESLIVARFGNMINPI